MSSIDPSETTDVNPTLVCRLQSRIPVQMAPLCESKATLPGRAIVLANVAFSP